MRSARSGQRRGISGRRVPTGVIKQFPLHRYSEYGGHKAGYTRSNSINRIATFLYVPARRATMVASCSLNICRVVLFLAHLP